MTVSSNYSSYASYNASTMSSGVQRGKPDFEAMAQEMLSSMDTDGNGSIDSGEFTSALQSGSGEDVSATANDIFSQLDANSDGSMSTEEFMSALKASRPQPPQGEMGSMPPPPPPPSDSSMSSSESDSSKLFSSLDTNQDGVISQDELSALFGQSSDQSETSAGTSGSNAASKNGEAFNDMRTKMLQQILSYYGSGSTTTDTTSSLSISA